MTRIEGEEGCLDLCFTSDPIDFKGEPFQRWFLSFIRLLASSVLCVWLSENVCLRMKIISYVMTFAFPCLLPHNGKSFILLDLSVMHFQR